ncbi:hypothetical protein [Nocardia goodfellowii]|uniref:Membrane protein involved in colicin uptake n=1 Tax=Nocardia goodfellowii TaxID=882446 RepID=A0ABS4Q6X0_9NOCA|nr:hypothetical protein [Nocardia goodfellowii]MBP2187333.1 membrane protein involved in colicin uptake [Nocardia goodfellowii]
MVNYEAEIERIAEETRRRSAMLLEELGDVRSRTARKSEELAEQATLEMAQFWEEKAEEFAKAQAEAEEKERAEMEARAEKERLMAEAREQREAIARSIAARKSKDVVLPIDDDDDDPEAEYYRRESWLV